MSSILEELELGAHIHSRDGDMRLADLLSRAATALRSVEPNLEDYEQLIAESYRLSGHTNRHGPGKVASWEERKAHQVKVIEARNKILEHTNGS